MFFSCNICTLRCTVLTLHSRSYPRHRRTNIKKFILSDESYDALYEKELDSNSFTPHKVKDNFYTNDIITKERDQSRLSFRPKIDPNLTSILLFPGQGSQFVGMGRKLLEYPNVRDIYEAASKILGYDLLRLCLNGPKEQLDKTVHCQPAVFVTSIAAVEKLKHTDPDAIESCVSASGYSIGEFAALTFAGSIEFEEAVRLVKVRAEAMQDASTKSSGCMMTIWVDAATKLGYACHVAKLYCKRELGFENPVCDISNYLHPGCKVISGHIEALDFISKNSGEFGIKRCEFLHVSGAFHSLLMAPSKFKFETALEGVEIKTPIVPVHSNVDSLKHSTPYLMKKKLTQQIYKAVQWEQTMHVLYSRKQGDQFPKTYEVGPGRQLGSILRKVNAKAFQKYYNVDV